MRAPGNPIGSIGSIGSIAAIAAIALAALPCGCVQSEAIDPMMKQAKYKPYAPNAFFDDGRAMRTPPPDTVPRERVRGSSELVRGLDAQGRKISSFPLPLTEGLLQQGRRKFNIHCAICHGLVGDGNSLVATQMSLRPPPSLTKASIRARPNGHLYEVITNGYGLMPGYAFELTVEERWAVISYLRALQRSQSATLQDAPPRQRDELEREAP